MKFRDYFSLKHILFAIGLIALMLLFAIRQSNNTVKVSFNRDMVDVTSAKYSMSIRYEDIVSARLTDLAEDGERIDYCYDDGTLRAGIWHNDTWGDYIIVADLDTSKCIYIEIEDGRVLVFSRKNDKTTKEDFETLQTYLK